MTAYSWLLFDADGTLFDYDQAEAAALESSFRYFALDFHTGVAETYRQINHQIWLDFENGAITSEALRVRRFELLFQAIKANASADLFSAQYLAQLGRQTQLMPAAYETLQALSERARMVIITNGLKDVQRPRLEQSAIGHFFEIVAISEEIGTAKPDPAYFDAVFQQMGNPPKQSTLVIGDSLTSDIQGGVNYGIDTCWYNPQGKAPSPKIQPTYEISSLDQLIALLHTR